MSHKENLNISSLLLRKIEFLAKFFVTTLIFFIIFFFGINYQAYSDITFSFIKNTLGYQDKEVQNDPKLEQPAENLLPLEVIRDPQNLKIDVDPLRLGITPPDNRLIIPRINKNIPIVKTSSTNYQKQKWDILDKEILDDLKKGVVIYPSSLLPGQNGNTVITGHSSWYAWVRDGNYNEVFARLHEVILGDKIYLYYNQKKYAYEVFDIKVVQPEDIEVMAPDAGKEILTVITCTPVGTNLRRLVLVAKRVE